jgi:hypothetical protein
LINNQSKVSTNPSAKQMTTSQKIQRYQHNQRLAAANQSPPPPLNGKEAGGNGGKQLSTSRERSLPAYLQRKPQ